MQQILAELLFRQLIGRVVIELGESSYHGDVALDDPLGLVAEDELFDQALAKGGHTILSEKGERIVIHKRSIDQCPTPLGVVSAVGGLSSTRGGRSIAGRYNWSFSKSCARSDLPQCHWSVYLTWRAVAYIGGADKLPDGNGEVDAMNVQANLQEALGDGFDVIRELTGGGMARVFLVLDRTLDRRIVVKVLSPELVAGVNADRFEREIRLMAQLQHPCIVPLLTVGETDGLPFYTMPFITGASLRSQIIPGEGQPAARVVRILRDVAAALAYAHERGIVHRDIKPENVLLSEGYAVVTDFGIAKALASARADGQSGTLTAVGVAIGTVADMAPEQALGDPTADHRVDIYALGIMAYEFLSGTPPFAGRTMQATIAAHIAEPPTPLESRRSDILPRLSALVMRCLAKAPEERPQSAQEFIDELDAAVSGELAPVGRGTTPSVTAHSIVPKYLGAVRARVTSTRVVAGAAVVVAIVAGSAVFRAPRLGAVSSVAVLPFTSAGAPADSELIYVGETVAVELANALRRSGALRIPPRSSTAVGGDSRLAPADVAARLGVDALVTGTLLRDAGHLRVTVRVLRGRDGATVWSRELSPRASELLALQRALADSVARVFGVTSAVAKGGPSTTSAAAYDAYLRARYLQERRGTGLRRAATLFDSAAKLDPSFAEAWAGLAESLALLPQYENVPADSVQGPALSAATAALRLDETLAEAHTAIGNVRANLLDWEGAKAAYQRARELDPGSATPLQYLAEILVLEGRLREAIPILQRAVALDPLSPVPSAVLASVYLFDGQIDSAYAQSRRTFDLDPKFAGSLRSYGRVLLAMDSTAKALELLSRSPAGITGLGVLGYAYAVSGRRDDALRVLRQLEQEDARHPVAALNIARLYVGLGDTSSALSWLERLPTRHEMIRQSTMPTDPAFRPLWTSARFAAVLRKLGLDAAELVRGAGAPVPPSILHTGRVR